MPGILWVGQRLEDYFAAFCRPPDAPNGLKVLTEQYDISTNAHDVKREVTQKEIDELKKLVKEMK